MHPRPNVSYPFCAAHTAHADALYYIENEPLKKTLEKINNQPTSSSWLSRIKAQLSLSGVSSISSEEDTAVSNYASQFSGSTRNQGGKQKKNNDNN